MSTKTGPGDGYVSTEQLGRALDALPAAFVVYGPDDRLLVCNEAYRAQYHPCEAFVRPGVSHEELQWMKVREGLDSNAEGRAEAFVRDEIERHRHGPAVEEWRDDQGRHIRLMRARMPDGETVGMRFDITDLREAQAALEARNEELSERKRALEKAQEQLLRLALTDEVTGLLNRRAATRALTDMAAECRRKGLNLAVLHIDLDGFKEVNDTYGHDAGDAVLKEVGRRLRLLVRAGDLVARIGGDEFLAALTCEPDSARPGEFAAEVVRRMAEPVRVGETLCHFGASVGLAVDSGPDIDPVELLKRADVALYQSKTGGRNRCSVFDAALREDYSRRSRLAHDLVEAIQSRAFEIDFQPIVEAATGGFVGAEALVRWRHPEFGLLLPGDFLQVAETSRLTADLDLAVLDIVDAERRRWTEARLVPPRIAVNVSYKWLRDPGLLPYLQRLDIDPAAFGFEILESVFAEPGDEALTWNLDGLREMGIPLAIDDFGSGHASIAAVLLIRPAWLKIDRSFTGRVTERDDARRVVEMSVTLAHSLGARVVAEGVETAAQSALLTELGCDRLQGYHHGRPMPAEQFREKLLDGALVVPPEGVPGGGARGAA